MAAQDWLKWRGALTGGTGSTVSIDWSTINVDQARTGFSGPDNRQSWAGLGRSGPNTCRGGRRPHGASGLLLGSGPRGWSMVGNTVRVHGPQARSRGGLRPLLPLLSLAHSAPSARGGSGVAAPSLFVSWWRSSLAASSRVLVLG